MWRCSFGSSPVAPVMTDYFVFRVMISGDRTQDGCQFGPQVNIKPLKQQHSSLRQMKNSDQFFRSGRTIGYCTEVTYREQHG